MSALSTPQMNVETSKTRRYPHSFRLKPLELVPLAILIAMIITIVAISPGLARWSTVETKSNAAMTLIFAATGQTFAILVGGIDLSIGGIISVSNSLAVTQMTNDPVNIIFWVVAISLLGLFAGAINGFIVAVLRITPFIATLATWSVWSGIAFLILEKDGGQVSNIFKNAVRSNLVGVPGSIILLVVLLGVWFWFKHTRSGILIYAVGTNEKGAALSGANVVRIKILAYSLSGLFAAFAGLYRTVQVGSGSPIAGDGLILPSVAAVVIGGTSLAGGRGGVGLTIVGALIMLFINDLIFFAGVRTFYTPMIQGLALILAVALNAYSYRSSLRKARQ